MDFGTWKGPFVPIRFTLLSKKAIDALMVHVVSTLFSQNTGLSSFNMTYPDYGNEVEAGLGIARAIQEGLEYFDLYLIHFPVALKYVEPSKIYPPGWTASSDPNVKDVEFAHIPMHQTWAAMEDLVEEGLARSIGISNFDIQLISDLLSYARIAPAVLQIEHHPYLTQPRLVDYAQAQGIAITAYCSFGPQSAVAAKLANVSELNSLLDHQLIKKISNDHSKSPSQVLLRWATQRGIAVIPKSKNLERMRQNMDMQWSLDDSEIGAISDLNQGLRLNDPVLVSKVIASLCNHRPLTDHRDSMASTSRYFPNTIS